MEDKLVTLKDESGVKIFPETRAKMVKTEAGKTVEEALKNANVSKETIEQALTGNITTHRHDTTYQETELETDVWDGTSISTSLQGSGTKDAPYLIQSCADWLHLRASTTQYGVYTNSDLGNATEFKPYFKITKNLDFGNKAIPEIESITPLLMCEFDGNRAKLSNFVDSEGIGILPPSAYYFAHDFVIDNLQTTANVSNGVAPIFSNIDTYSAILNCTVNANVTVIGEATSESGINIVVSGEYHILLENDFKTRINDYVESNGCFCGVDINITDNTTKEDGVCLIVTIANSYVFHPITLYCTNPLYDITGGVEPIGEYVIGMMCLGSTPAAIYTNSDGSNTIIVQDLEGEATTFTGTPKSLEEMQSASFVDELNAHLPKPAFKQDPEGGTPILAQYGAIAYDGYVKQSEFESFKKNMPTGSINLSDIFYELPSEILNLTSGSSSDTISETIGGEDGLNGIIQAIKDNKIIRVKTVIDSDPNHMYIIANMSCCYFIDLGGDEYSISLSYIATNGVSTTLSKMNIGYKKSTNEFSFSL